MKEKYSTFKQRNFTHDLGWLCAAFRRQILRITLQKLSFDSGIPIPTLSSFELGRSSNMRFLYVYLVSCETDLQKDIFIDRVHKLLERSYYNE